MYVFSFLAVPFLSSVIPMELSTYTLKLSENWASSTSHVFASDVILSQAVTVHIAITRGATFRSPGIDFAIFFTFYPQENLQIPLHGVKIPQSI